MDSEVDYTVAKLIVQSGQLDEEWDSLRQGRGTWPVVNKFVNSSSHILCKSLKMR